MGGSTQGVGTFYHGYSIYLAVLVNNTCGIDLLYLHTLAVTLYPKVPRWANFAKKVFFFRVAVWSTKKKVPKSAQKFQNGQILPKKVFFLVFWGGFFKKKKKKKKKK